MWPHLCSTGLPKYCSHITNEYCRSVRNKYWRSVRSKYWRSIATEYCRSCSWDDRHYQLSGEPWAVQRQAGTNTTKRLLSQLCKITDTHNTHTRKKASHTHKKILVWETLFFLHRCTLCTVTYKKCTGDVWRVAVSRLRICLIACSFLCFCLFGVVACALYKKCTVQKVHCHCTGDVWRVAVSRLPRIPRAQKQKPPQHFSLHAMIH